MVVTKQKKIKLCFWEGLNQQKPRLQFSICEVSDFSDIGYQSQASRWCICRSDRIKDLASECEGRSFWVIAVSLVQVVI